MEPALESLSGTRICYAITKDGWGGAQAYVQALAATAANRGAYVSVLVGSTSHTTTTLSTRAAEAGIPVTTLSHMERDIGMLREWRAFKELLSFLRKERPDVLHLNSSKMGALGALAGRIAGVPYIIFTAHGWPHRESRSVLWKAVVWTASWVTVLLSHKVIAVSDCDHSSSPALFLRKRVVRIYNGIPTFGYKDREDARALLIERNPNIASFTTWLLMNSELHANKGVDVAIRALGALTQTHKDVALVVQGEGEQRSSLQRIAEKLGVADRVFLLGFVSDARSNLAAADIFLMPSRKEGLPLALLEAGMVGRTVIVSAVGGMPEVVEHGVTGLLVPPNDHSALARALSQCIRDSERCASLGARLHSRVASTFSEERMLEETFSVYP